MTTTTGRIPASLDQLAERYVQAWNDHDLEAILALQTPDSTFAMHGAGGRRDFEGLDACREIYDALLKAWPDQRFEVQRLDVVGDLYVCESVLTATLALPWQMGERTFEPEGQAIRMDVVDIMRCSGNLIRHKSSWIDGYAMREQLAA